ncbi:MAG: glycosyltransferase family 4 protein [bacterium]
MKTPSQFWSCKGIYFDDVDAESACLPYHEKVEIGFQGLSLTKRRIGISGKIITLKHAQGDEDCFARRLFYLKQPASFPRWQSFLFQRLGIVAYLTRLVEKAEKQLSDAPPPALRVQCNGRCVGNYVHEAKGEFKIEFCVPRPSQQLCLQFKLTRVGFANFMAWLGKISERWPLPQDVWEKLQKFRLGFFQHRKLRFESISIDDEEAIHFRQRFVKLPPAIISKIWSCGLNIIGFFSDQTGIGESARCAARAAEAADISTALIQLKVAAMQREVDDSYSARLQENNPHPINVFHLLPIQAREIDSLHGHHVRLEKYNIAYWAWELMKFPEDWSAYHRYFDEIWCPSRFTAEAIARAVPLPVLTMPHAVSFSVPQGNFRAKFGLPEHQYLFLFIYDLNSLQVRKNPQAVMRAFQNAFSNGNEAALAIKVQGAKNNPDDFAKLQEAARQTPNCFILSKTLPRHEVYELEQACDCFVSLHRSEGFGLAVAEAMYLGKPVISTDWSATAEFVNAGNGCPVKYQLAEIEKNVDVYAKGEQWAEADVEHAAHYMKRLVADPSWGKNLGARGAEDVRRMFSPQAVGALYRQRLESMFYW